MWIDILLFVVGGTGVWLGAEGMVRGAVKLADYLGVPSLIIGLTIVAFGTSAPELVVSGAAALAGQNQIALGNVIGSNIINIGLVLGLSAVIAPITVSKGILKRDVPMLLGATFAVAALAYWHDDISRLDGLILLLCFGAHTFYCFKTAAREQARITTAPGYVRPELKPRHIVFLLAGMIILAGGAQTMVNGAVGIAEYLGISKRVIGMTIVALGTSVPELAASLVAAKHGESGLAIGNVIGSNIYNVTLILGTVAVISPVAVQLEKSIVDFAFFVAITVVLVPMIRIGWKISRIDGALLVVMLAGAMGSLFLS